MTNKTPQMRVFVKIEAYVDVDCASRSDAVRILGGVHNYIHEGFELAGTEMTSTDFEITLVEPIGEDE